MARYTFTVEIDAPRDQVFALWTNLERAPEWIEGMAGVSEVSGPTDQAGTSYNVHFGSWSTSKSTILEAEPARFIRTEFGTWLLRGEQSALFEDIGGKTRVTQTFDTVGVIPAIAARIFATGSYKGSFRGELQAFRQISEREAASPAG